MLIKTIDDKTQQLTELERLLASAPPNKKTYIEKDLRALKAGINGEQQSAYLIDFDFKDSKFTAVIHDLRLEINGRVAQIDHLLIHRTLNCFVLETKSMHAGIKITEEGEFLQWNDFKKSYEGMASPLAQNERHMSVIKDAFGQIEMPTRLGVRLTPSIQSFVLISPHARIDRPKKFDTSNVIKADTLLKTIQSKFENEGLLSTLSSMSKFVSTETIEEIARKLVALHKPASFNFAAKYGLSETSPTQNLEPVTKVATASDPSNEKHLCRLCKGSNLSIQYGKYGYYFKCADCNGNTPIKLSCGNNAHKERLRKEGNKFFRECAECKTSNLFF